MSSTTIFFLLIILPFIFTLHRKSFDIFSPHQTFIESHRGINRELPQNTMIAFNRVLTYDIDGFETDTWITKDNVPVIIHGGNDGQISSYYDHEGIITELTWDEIKEFRTIEGNQPMPRLDEVFDLIKDKVFINLEIKDDRVEKTFDIVSKLIEEKGVQGQMEISSFHHGYYDAIENYNKGKKEEEHLVFGFLYNGGTKIDDIKFGYKRHTINLYWKDVTKEICDKAHESGMAVMAWFGMKDEENTEIYKNLIEKGADAICSNTSLLAKKYRDNYYFNQKENSLKILRGYINNNLN